MENRMRGYSAEIWKRDKSSPRKNYYFVMWRLQNEGQPREKDEKMKKNALFHEKKVQKIWTEAKKGVNLHRKFKLNPLNNKNIMKLTKQQRERKRWFEQYDGGKIRTRITKRDIKAMHLTEDEQWLMEGIADEVNRPYLYTTASTTTHWLRGGYTPDKYENVLIKAFKYFVEKRMRELGVDQTSLRATCEYIAETFRTVAEWVMPRLRGMFYDDPDIYTTDTFGLNTIGYRH